MVNEQLQSLFSSWKKKQFFCERMPQLQRVSGLLCVDDTVDLRVNV